MVSLLHDLLTHSAARFPDKTCLVQGARMPSFSELEKEVRQLAQLLMQTGVSPGDRVAIHLDKSVEEAAAMLAVSMVGGVSVNVNSLLKARQVRHILQDSGAGTMITSYPRLKNLGGELAGMASLRTLIGCGNRLPLRDAALDAFQVVDVSAAAECKPCAPVRRIDRDVAAIIYTSGSTGLPKGVVLSHRNLVAGAESVSTYLQNTSEDRILSILPIITPPFVIALALVVLFGRTGLVTGWLDAAFGIPRSRWIYGLPGVTLAQLLSFSPIAFMILHGALAAHAGEGVVHTGRHRRAVAALPADDR